MVKLSFYFIACLALVGCQYNDSILVHKNEWLAYVNYDQFTECVFPVIPFNHYPVTPDFSLDAKAQKNKIPITGNDTLLILKIIDDFNNRYYKPEEYNYNSIESGKKTDIFFCGKISIVDSISSFLILLETEGLWGWRSPVRNLYLLNYKNNQLTSTVNLSTYMGGFDSGITIITYLIHNIYFSQVNYSFASSPYMYQSIEWYIPTQEISDYVKIKKDASVLYFSTFIIDENGFVQPVNV